MRGIGKAAVAALGGCLAVSAVQAASIGVNFYNTTTGETLALTDVAGVAAQSNWNNMTISSGDANGHTNIGTLNNPIDSTGTTVSGMSVQVTATSTTQVWPVDGASWGFSGGDGTLHDGELRPCATITITGIPYSQFDIYGYAGGNGGAGGGNGTATLTANSPGIVDGNTYIYNLGYASPNSYSLATTTTAGNYVQFVGNTASSVTINWNPTESTWEGIDAIQIVQTPEPASIGLLGLGSLTLLRRRRD